MKRRDKAAGKAVKARRRKPLALTRRNAPKAVRRPKSSAASQSKQVALLTCERDEALARENATGEILSSISGSMTDAKPVFDAIVRNLLRLFGTRFAIVVLLRDGMIEIGGFKGEPGFEKFAARFPVPLDERTLVGKTILAGQTMQFTPIVGHPDSSPFVEQSARSFGFNSLISTPMIRDGKTIGAIATAHRDAVRFTDKQIALIKSFADQAVIAIENTRLLKELRQRTDDLSESLEQQTATSEVLRVISSSTGELQPIFQVMLENATRLCAAKFGNLYLCEGDAFRTTAMHNVPPAFAEARRRDPLVRPDEPGSALGRLRSSKSPSGDFTADYRVF